MPRIHVLSDDIANQIAAGEVVERPASVVKELVENAIDAGASHLDLEIREGGTKEITISDNGCGMSSEDACLAFERHATSKLQSASDLFSINTLGFRGEALPSIASVAKVTLITREQTADNGHKLVIDGGQREPLLPWGTPPGTRISVADLFYNTPARRKFLSSPQAEAGRVRDAVARLALAAPQVAFRLTQDDRIVLETPGNNSLIDTILALYGRDVASQLIRVQNSAAGVSVNGYISRPELTRHNRRDQIIILNGRVVQCRSLSFVLEEAYRSLLPSKRHPLAFLAITLPAESVDVNVHPAKTEVRLREERQVTSIVLRILRTALQFEAERVPVAAAKQTAVSWEPEPDVVQERVRSWEPTVQEPVVPVSIYRAKEPPIRLTINNSDGTPDPGKNNHNSAVTPTEAPTSAPYRLIGQVLNSYILVEREGGMLLVDQHAAHERVIYEQLVGREEQRTSQSLLVPYSLELAPREAALMDTLQSELAGLGFEVTHFGGSNWLLRSLPDIYRGRFRPEDFADLLADMASGTSNLKPNELRERLLIRVACKTAIKAGQRLHNAEMIELLDKLWQCQLPYTCPHGRPTALRYSPEQLFKMFHP